MEAGLIYGHMPHHLDHVAVWAHLKGIPLIATDESVAAQAEKFYPGLEVVFWDSFEAPEKLVSAYDTIYCCLPRPLFDEAFFIAQKLLRKTVRTIWLPHGNSDKGHLAPSMEGLQHDAEALAYGQKMVDFLKLKNVYDHLQVKQVGNFRLAYYQQHKLFYDRLVEERIPVKQKLFLYAPTWKDTENSSSLDGAWKPLIEKLPDGYALAIKPHPNADCPDIGEHPNVFLLKDFPPIYALLNRSAAYIGDMSSIGYDFLAFDRPMIFLNPNRRDPKLDPGLFLHRCGRTVAPEEYGKIYDLIEGQDELSAVRKEVYRYTFDVKQVDI